MKNTLKKDNIKILLLEWISPEAVKYFETYGYKNVELLPNALQWEELKEKIKDVHFIWIRSRTNLTEDILKSAKELIAVWCFCIWTNQVDLDAARKLWIPVFNAPFANTRSVAELTLATIIHLMRWIPEKNLAAHKRIRMKTSKNSCEVRWKNLWIIWYGNIWSQLSVLASALDMNIYYYDIENKLALGNSHKLNSIDELLEISDIVTLHVPETPETINMFTAKQFAKMKKWSFFINYARGTLVDIDALTETLKSWHLLWAAIDVYPKEPKTKDEKLESPLCDLPNVLLTPHIWGSTWEAQLNIWDEVAEKLVKYSDEGTTSTSVNFPEVNLPEHSNAKRILNIHKNIPWVMRQINKIFADNEINIVGQYLKTFSEIWYVVLDVETELDSSFFLDELSKIEANIKTRVLY